MIRRVALCPKVSDESQEWRVMFAFCRSQSPIDLSQLAFIEMKSDIELGTKDETITLIEDERHSLEDLQPAYTSVIPNEWTDKDIEAVTRWFYQQPWVDWFCLESGPCPPPLPLTANQKM